MKAKILFAIGIAMFVLAACTDTGSDEFCNDPGATCPDNSTIEATSCCTSTSCYWVYNGTKYNCNGEDCTAVINQIVGSACAAPSGYFDVHTTDLENLRAQLQTVTSELMIQARQASGCEY